MEEKNHYFISKTSIYDYAMLLHLPQSNGSNKTILVKVTGNKEIDIYQADTTEGKKVICDFLNSWTSLSLQYSEREFNQIIMPPTVMDKMPEVIKEIADKTGTSIEDINKIVSL